MLRRLSLALVSLVLAFSAFSGTSAVPAAAHQVFSAEVEPYAEDVFTDPDLNPAIRLSQFRAELYPEQFRPATPQGGIRGDNYRFPLSAPVSTYVTQTYFGPYSHQTSRAIDWFGNNMKVAASRTGVITTLEQGGKWDGWCNSYNACRDNGGIWNGNHILVTHADGTYAYYIHMEPGTIDPNLRVGSPVQQGQILGDVGATGYTCGNSACSRPGEHLHFQVNLPNRGGTIATPFEDCNVAGNLCDTANIPVSSRSYTSINYPPAFTGYDNRRPGVYFFGTDLALQAITLANNSSVRLGSPNTNTSEWTYSTSTQRIEGNNNFCLADTGTTRLKLATCSNAASQRWTQASGNRIRNAGSSRCLQTSSVARGAYLNLATCAESQPLQYFRTSNQFYDVASPVVDIN